MMRNFCIAIASVALFCCVAPDVRSQTDGNVLRGIKELSLIIDDSFRKAPRCGIRKNKIRNTAMDPLSAAGFAVNADSTIYIYIKVDTFLSRPKGAKTFACISYIFLELFFYGVAEIPVIDRPVYAKVTLWKKETVSVSGTNAHFHFIKSRIKEFVKEFITDWNFDNK